MKLELLQDGVLIWTRTYAETVLPGTNPAPPPVVPPPAPPVVPPAAPPAGWTPNMNPLTFDAPMGAPGPLPFDINAQWSYNFQAPAGRVNVHPIIFRSDWFKGAAAVLSTAVLTTNQGKRDYVISAAPGSMTPVNPYVRRVNQGLADALRIALDGSPGALKKDTQYYLNVKSSTPGYAVDYRLNATPLA